MRSLRVVEVLADAPTFARHHGLHLPKRGDTYSLGTGRGSGAFGQVWSVKPDEPRVGEPAVVVKEINENESLADRVIALQKALAKSADRDWPESLLAFPFSIVIADLDGDEREGIFMLDLVELGYENAEPHFEPSDVERYQRRPIYERVELTHALARGAAVLETVGFVHGDQNIPNLMLNFETLDAQIVDLDAGAIQVTGKERSRAEGKADDCVPPEVKVVTPNGVEVDQTRWDMGAERWAVGMLAGYLAFGISPSFFLVRMSASVIDAYSNDDPWPQVNLQAPHAMPGVEPAYKFWRPVLEAGPGRLPETFVRFFRAGTRGDERPTAQDWADALEPARQKPQFVSLEAKPLVVPEGTEVVIRWEAEGAEYVEHPDLGELPPKGEATLVVEKSARHTLTAINYYGRETAATEVVRVVPLPRLTSIPIAGFPGLELQASIAAAAPPRAVSGFPPRLVRSVGAPAAAARLPRGPRPSPPPAHFGQLFRPIPVSRKICDMMRKGLVR